MGKFIKGDIVVIPFPFTDLSVNKWRELALSLYWFQPVAVAVLSGVLSYNVVYRRLYCNAGF